MRHGSSGLSRSARRPRPSAASGSHDGHATRKSRHATRPYPHTRTRRGTRATPASMSANVASAKTFCPRRSRGPEEQVTIHAQHSALTAKSQELALAPGTPGSARPNQATIEPAAQPRLLGPKALRDPCSRHLSSITIDAARRRNSSGYAPETSKPPATYHAPKDLNCLSEDRKSNTVKSLGSARPQDQ